MKKYHILIILFITFFVIDINSQNDSRVFIVGANSTDNITLTKPDGSIENHTGNVLYEYKANVSKSITVRRDISATEYVQRVFVLKSGDFNQLIMNIGVVDFTEQDRDSLNTVVSKTITALERDAGLLKEIRAWLLLVQKHTK